MHGPDRHHRTGSERSSAAVDDLLARSFDEVADGQCPDGAEPERIEGSASISSAAVASAACMVHDASRRAEVGQRVRIVVGDGVSERGHQPPPPGPDRGDADRAGPEPGAIPVEARAADEAGGGTITRSNVTVAVADAGAPGSSMWSGSKTSRNGRGRPSGAVVVAVVDGQQGLVEQRRAEHQPRRPRSRQPPVMGSVVTGLDGPPEAQTPSSRRGSWSRPASALMATASVCASASRPTERSSAPKRHSAAKRSLVAPHTWPGEIEAARFGQAAQPSLDLPLGRVQPAGGQEASPSTFRESAKPPRTLLWARPLVVTTSDRGEATG